MTSTVRSIVPVSAAVFFVLAACQSSPTGPDAHEIDGATEAAQPEPGPDPGPPLPVASIAFIGDDSMSRTQVYTVKRTGGAVTQLTSLPSNHAWDAWWSPAGPNRIAFRAFLYDDPLSISHEHALLVGSTGTGFQDLTPLTENGVWHQAWSPDGTKLALWRTPGGSEPHYIQVINADGTGLTQLASDADRTSRPAWTPDGQRIIYALKTDHPRTPSVDERGIWSIKPDGTGRVQVFQGSGGALGYDDFEYSPDGTKVVMCRNGLAIVMKSDWTAPVSLGLMCNSDHGPRWSPNGKRILSTKIVGAAEQIFAVNPDGSNLVQLTSGWASDNAAWSRGGGWIAYRRGPSGGQLDIWVMKADGSGQTQITFGMKVSGGISWGPTPTMTASGSPMPTSRNVQVLQTESPQMLQEES